MTPLQLLYGMMSRSIDAEAIVRKMLQIISKLASAVDYDQDLVEVVECAFDILLPCLAS